jgi:YesN/AraC family two-component response regulator
MVCSRCKLMVKSTFESEVGSVESVELGEVTLASAPTTDQLKSINKKLLELGFELIDDRKKRLIEKIKNEVVQLVHHSGGALKTNLSTFLADRIHYDYTYLSNLFSEVEGTTIEKYFILQRIEKAKELIVYGELSLTEIADKLGYSSGAYLSSQFKQVTGLTPTFYRNIKDHKRFNIEDL